ncbi:hypothetical protein P2G88_05375 [Aliiglaciecola sp. CAU 1673]|uniref:hypothetical protein n=1 Tax=Aliiglaciecola sp. CAU 1673 TaxID=3032595 RepID=UPI0023DA1CFA|nr:hypothetical protein [Aliiglaciecola sp. CAU 1673]MDF2177674.1 hypothetical protein [Aliiglaciecola sp. CAU 1673]
MKSLMPLSLIVLSLVLNGCAANNKPCERVLEVKQQEQQCNEWRKVMMDSRYPQQALTAKKRYEEACLDIRYYRDQYDTICKGDEKAIGERQKQP